MTHQQLRLRRENFNGAEYIPFSERTYKDKDIKIKSYGTIQDLYDIEYAEEIEEY